MVKDGLVDKDIYFRITGSRLGLTSNTIHYLDVISYLTKDGDFTINSDLLDKKLAPNKRKNFIELSGTLYANFKNGSRFEITSYISGDAPPLIEIFNSGARYIIKNDEAWVSYSKNNWKWEEIAFRTPLISETTTSIVEDIFNTQNCPLPSYKESAKIHLPLLEALTKFLNKTKKDSRYPFT